MRRRFLLVLSCILPLLCSVPARAEAREGSEAQATLEKCPFRPLPGIGTIVVDPGHGGSELGAHFEDVLEKELVLDVALRLTRLLRERLAARVILTREADVDVSLAERSEIARRAGPGIFVSIHANSGQRKEADGYETFILSAEASDDDAARTAALENAAFALKGNPLEDPSGLTFILGDMAAADNLRVSELLATRIQESLSRARPGENRGVRQAPFYVLHGSGMPAALVEVGFLSNEWERKDLCRDATRDVLAEAIYRGILDLAQIEETRLAQKP